MNNHSRNGKIARLPQAIREELNQRLQKGETGRSLTIWLNDLPEVRAVMDAFFAGSAIREQNVSEWKKRGYEEWLRYQEAVALAEHLYEQGEETKAMAAERMPMSEVLTLWLTSRYVVSTREIERMEGEKAWRKQRQMCNDLMKMRRAEHQTERLQLERERLELRREEIEFKRERAERKGGAGGQAKARPFNKSEAENEDVVVPEPGRRERDISDEEKIAWARRPENLERISPPLTEHEKEARWREILRIPRPNFGPKGRRDEAA